MKKLLTILFLIIAITSKSQVSVTAGGGIAPTGSYAGYYGTYLQGATKVVYDTVARNAIPSYYRDTLTFMVYTKSDSSYWILSGGTTNSNYKKVSQFSSVAPTATIKGSGVIGNVAYFNGTTQLGSTNNLSIDTPSGTLYAHKQQTTNSNYKPLNTDPSSPSVGVSVYSKTVNGVTEPYYIDSLGRSSRLSTTGVSVVNNTGSIIPQFYPICTDSSSSLAVAKGNYQKFFPYAVTQDAIPIGGYGRVVYNGGIVTGLNLSTYQNGASVYLADGGGLSKTPSTVYPAIRIGVVSSNLVNGSLLVSIGSASSDTSSLPNLLTSNNYWTGNNTYGSVLLRNFYDTSAKATLGYINNSATISDNVSIYLPSVRSTGFVDVDTVAYRSWVRDSILGSGYVPYTGATTTLDMGTNAVNAASFKVNGTGGNGHVDLKWQSADAPSIANSTALYADASGNLKWKNDGNYTTTISSSANNTNVTVTAPNRNVKIDSITTSTTTAISGLLKGNGTAISAATSGAANDYLVGGSLSATRNASTGSIFTYNSATGAYNLDTTRLSSGGLTGNGTPSGQLMPFGLWSTANSRLSSTTVAKFNYDSTNGNFNIGTSTPQSSYLLNLSSPNTLTSALNISTTTGSSVTSGISLNLIGKVGNAYGISINNTNVNTVNGIQGVSGINDMLTGSAVRAFSLTTTGSSYLTYNGGRITGSNLIYGGISVLDQSSSPFSFSAVSNGLYSVNAIVRSYNLSHQAAVFQSSAIGTQLLNSYNYMAGNGSSYNYVETNQFGSIMLDNTYIASNKVTKTGFVWATTIAGTMAERMRLSAGALLINTTSPNGVDSLIVNGSTQSTAFNSNATQTTVNASTSGSCVFSQPFAGSSYKKVIIYCNAALGTASYTYPTAFTNTPTVLSTNGLATSLITSISTTSVTVTGSSSSGFLIIEGY